ncbi:hypothetical protein FK216_06060 [Moraxellaceae bacterium AER2_44_116]|nr:hypothetical protein [Moraxellaceae bacterium]TQC98420.1 hypothetical protein FK216_06060 [Moraxellaceae bacterium AER2_44_116]
MQEKTTALPEKIQAAIDHHQTAKQAFIDSYDKYKATLARLDKHRKTAQAAHNQAQQTGQQWRELIRLSDGALTKEITALRRKETEDNDLAEEFDKVVLEVESIAIESEREAYEMWCKHGEACHNAAKLYDDHVLQNATRELLALPEAKVIALNIRQSMNKSIANSEYCYGLDATKSGQEQYLAIAKEKAGNYLVSLFLGLIDGVEDNQMFDDVRKSLTMENSSLIDKRKFAPKSPAQKHIERYQATDNAA